MNRTKSLASVLDLPLTFASQRLGLSILLLSIASACAPMEDDEFDAPDMGDAESVETVQQELAVTCQQQCLTDFRDCRRGCPPPTQDDPCGSGCSEEYNACLEACAPPVDTDGDGVPDGSDNCPQVANANQANCDGDAQGNACDSFNGHEVLQSTNRTLNNVYRDGDFCGQKAFNQTLWKRYVEVQTIKRTYLRDYCDGTPDSTRTTQQTGQVICDVEYWPTRTCGPFDPRYIPYPQGNPTGWCLIPHF
jgi:hypothetical protein